MEYVSDDQLQRFKVPDLKDYLRKHGQIVSGKRAELLDRAKGISVLRVRPVDNVRKDDEIESAARREEKLVTPLGDRIPHPSTLKGWSRDLYDVPNFSETDIYNYLVLTRKAKRQLKSKVFYKDRHVHKVEIHQVNDECSHCVVRCQVTPFLPSVNKKENLDYTVWACLAKISGNVLSADCSCTAGLGEACNHIGALLYALVDINNKKEDGMLASTSMKCTWNNPRKRRLSPKKVIHIFRNKGDNNEDESEDATFHATVNENRFRERLLKSKSKAGWLTNFEVENCVEEDYVPIPELDKVQFMYRDYVDLNNPDIVKQCQQHFSQMNISTEQCKIVENKTRGQSSNELWTSLCRGRITSSNFGKVMVRRETTAPDNSVKELMGYYSFDNKYVKWGRDHEAAARRMYCNKNNNFDVKQCGLIVNPMYPHLGASPDGLIHDPSVVDGNGILEIKCPASEKWKTQSPHECAKDPNFFCKLDPQGNVVLKRNHMYFFQVQGQLAITKRKWCDFVVWTLRQPFSVERIYFDEALWEQMEKKLTKFYVTAIIPEIYTLRVLRGVPLYK